MPLLAKCKCGQLYADNGKHTCPRCTSVKAAARKTDPRRKVYSTAGWKRKREQVKREQAGLCAHCRKRLPLSVNHRDGNTLNNQRHNLEALCTPCHARADMLRRREQR